MSSMAAWSKIALDLSIVSGVEGFTLQLGELVIFHMENKGLKLGNI